MNEEEITNVWHEIRDRDRDVYRGNNNEILVTKFIRMISKL